MNGFDCRAVEISQKTSERDEGMNTAISRHDHNVSHRRSDYEGDRRLERKKEEGKIAIHMTKKVILVDISGSFSQKGVLVLGVHTGSTWRILCRFV